jgi:alkylation response protein AidB-like acyl-CoA dehydrogenase
MEFGWSAQQQRRYREIVDFCQSELGADIDAREPTGGFSRRDWTCLGERGLLGLCLPREHGGQGLGALETAHAVEALGYGCRDMGLVFSAAAHTFGCSVAVLAGGAPELRARLLPELAAGRRIGATAASEAQAGSDLAAMRTSARPVPGARAYVLDGEKRYVTNGPIADVFVVYASTDPSVGSLGLTAFAIEVGSPGLVIGEQTGKMGLRTSPMCEVTLSGCRVPEECRIGQEGDGLSLFLRSMRWERTCLIAGYLGMLERQIELCVEYANRREQFGNPIARYQSIAHRIVEMKVRLEAARFLVYRAAWLNDEGDDAMAEAAIAKLATAEAAVASSLDAVRVFGAAGIVSGGEMDRMLRDAVPATMLAGTPELQKNLIAVSLGLRV